MGSFHEVIRLPEGAVAWVYLFSENNITEVSGHWHHSLELTMICRGQAEYTINGLRAHLQAGDLILINCGDMHECSVSEDGCEAINIMIPGHSLTQFGGGKDNVFFRLNRKTEAYGLLVHVCERVYRVFANRKQDPYAQVLINSLVSNIVYLLFSHFIWDDFALVSVESQKYRKRCRDILTYIENHFREDITLETLIHEFSFSKEHIARIFRVYMGTTFKKHLTRMRLYYAHKRLTGSDLTVGQIAADSGFPDERAFISCFRKLYGTTPGQYRRKYHRDVKIEYYDAKKPPQFYPDGELPLMT